MIYTTRARITGAIIPSSEVLKAWLEDPGRGCSDPLKRIPKVKTTFVTILRCHLPFPIVLFSQVSSGDSHLVFMTAHPTGRRNGEIQLPSIKPGMKRIVKI